eukprot:TRINITY_DN66962_c0_g1_i1.p1 TRINITY_DN66962_c0_g1~~TRINITY_DN66962_c0_g1_i1.p1  ORF type:complete len:260 (+),score=41.43 TRINITY_DN66962_c0_g1_i1:81-860(+)
MATQTSQPTAGTSAVDARIVAWAKLQATLTGMLKKMTPEDQEAARIYAEAMAALTPPCSSLAPPACEKPDEAKQKKDGTGEKPRKAVCFADEAQNEPDEDTSEAPTVNIGILDSVSKPCTARDASPILKGVLKKSASTCAVPKPEVPLAPTPEDLPVVRSVAAPAPPQKKSAVDVPRDVKPRKNQEQMAFMTVMPVMMPQTGIPSGGLPGAGLMQNGLVIMQPVMQPMPFVQHVTPIPAATSAPTFSTGLWPTCTSGGF